MISYLCFYPDINLGYLLQDVVLQDKKTRQGMEYVYHISPLLCAISPNHCSTLTTPYLTQKRYKTSIVVSFTMWWSQCKGPQSKEVFLLFYSPARLRCQLAKTFRSEFLRCPCALVIHSRFEVEMLYCCYTQFTWQCLQVSRSISKWMALSFQCSCVLTSIWNGNGS